MSNVTKNGFIFLSWLHRRLGILACNIGQCNGFERGILDCFGYLECLRQ